MKITMISEKRRAPSRIAFCEGLGCGTCRPRLEGSTIVPMGTGVVVDMHLEHLLALGAVVDVGRRGDEGVEVAFHPVATVEGVDADDAELSLRSLPRELLVDSAIATFADCPRIVRHFCLLKVLDYHDSLVAGCTGFT